jgi:hypothetical protein
LLAVGLLALVVSAGCASRTRKLDLLRAEYQESRRRPLKHDLDPQIRDDLLFLVGMSSSTIQAALGPPDRCTDQIGAESRLLPLDECLLYRFDLEDIPGAYSLRVRLDRRGNCIEPRWLVQLL